MPGSDAIAWSARANRTGPEILKMQMLGNDGLVTISKYWREWANPQLIVCVLNNQDLNQVTWEQRVMEGDPKYEASQELPDVPYDRLAEDLGLRGLRMARREDVERVWDGAFATDRPVVINAYTDPEVPPLPPHITFKQARHYASAVLHDPERGAMLKNTVRGVVSTFAEKVTP